MTARRQTFLSEAGWTLAKVGLCVMATGLLLAAYQCVRWLQDGYWTPYPLSEIFAAPDLSWRGLNRILLWLREVPLALALFIGGLALSWLGISIEERTPR